VSSIRHPNCDRGTYNLKECPVFRGKTDMSGVFGPDIDRKKGIGIRGIGVSVHRSDG